MVHVGLKKKLSDPLIIRGSSFTLQGLVPLTLFIPIPKSNSQISPSTNNLLTDSNTEV